MSCYFKIVYQYAVFRVEGKAVEDGRCNSAVGGMEFVICGENVALRIFFRQCGLCGKVIRFPYVISVKERDEFPFGFRDSMVACR